MIRQSLRLRTIVAPVFACLVALTAACSGGTAPSSPSAPSADSPSTVQGYMIAGVVTTAEGHPVSGATVSLVNAATHDPTGKTTTTDSEGNYALSNVSAPDMGLLMIAPGFGTR
jgi:hypothetical protein